MSWTREQEHAIYDRGKNILVAAAAGSGKTAVLVERIRNLILNERSSVDRMLVVTFTNAAASEMKEKIEKSIRETIDRISAEMKEMSTGEELSLKKRDVEYLKKQLDLLPGADISTFHGFSLNIIKKYFYLIGADPVFSIADNNRQAILKEQAMDQLLEEYYEESSPQFIAFLRKHSSERNDNSIRAMVTGTCRMLESLPEPEKWLDEHICRDTESPEEFEKSDMMGYIWDETERVLKEAGRRLQSEIDRLTADGLKGGAEFLELDLAQAALLTDAAAERNFDAFGRLLEETKAARYSKKYFSAANNPGYDGNPELIGEKYKDNRPVRSAIANLKKNFFYGSLAENYKLIRETEPDVLFLRKMVKRYSEIYSELKAEQKLVDFGDIEHMAFDILKNDEAASYYRGKFEHIFVDEYQDSNLLQEALIGRIARENNCFMVGDVKQSIYRFRLADPDIFENRYNRCAASMDEDGDGTSEKIDLNRNFRSKSPVLDFINEVFRPLMRGYTREAELYPGAEGADKSAFKPRLYLVDTSDTDDPDIDSEIKALKKADKEALACVKLIRDYMGKTIFDTKLQKERVIKKRDIVILLRAVKSYGEHFYKTLSENGISAYIDDSDGYFDTIEINTFLSLLSLIDNEKQDVPLISVMRSSLFDFTTEELAAIRINCRRGSYHDAVTYASKNDLTPIGTKCGEMLKKLARYREMAGMLPLEEIMWEMMLDTGFYLTMGAMPGGMQRQANLRALIDKAIGYRKSSDGSLYGFIKYIDAVKKTDVHMGQVKLVGEEDDVVRIMTVHKSKGLEFPMVILAGCSRQLRYDGTKTGASVHKSIGIGLPYVDYKHNCFQSTLLQSVINYRSHQEEVEEQQRVLYVALTRAKDILVLLGTSDKPEEQVDKLRYSEPAPGSYLSMIGANVIWQMGAYGIIRDNDLKGILGAGGRRAEEALKLIDNTEAVPTERIRKLMEFEYPHMEDLKIKSKYSVSELNAEKESIMLAEPASFHIREGFTAAQTGTFTHKALELMDFQKALQEGVSYMNELKLFMVESEFLTEEEASAIDYDMLMRFAESDLGKRMARAQSEGKLYRERPFNMVTEVEGRPAVAQGIIDACFEEEAEGKRYLVLVDYKTTTRKDIGEIKKTYEMQIELYKRALEKATGIPVKEACLYLTNISRMIDM